MEINNLMRAFIILSAISVFTVTSSMCDNGCRRCQDEVCLHCRDQMFLYNHICTKQSCLQEIGQLQDLQHELKIVKNDEQTTLLIALKDFKAQCFTFHIFEIESFENDSILQKLEVGVLKKEDQIELSVDLDIGIEARKYFKLEISMNSVVQYILYWTVVFNHKAVAKLQTINVEKCCQKQTIDILNKLSYRETQTTFVISQEILEKEFRKNYIKVMNISDSNNNTIKFNQSQLIQGLVEIQINKSQHLQLNIYSVLENQNNPSTILKFSKVIYIAQGQIDVKPTIQYSQIAKFAIFIYMFLNL